MHLRSRKISEVLEHVRALLSITPAPYSNTLATCFRSRLFAARTYPCSAFNHTYSLLEHILVPFSNTPALCCKTGAQASTRRRTTSHRSRPRTRAYRSNAPRTAKRPRTPKRPRTAKRPRATPSPSPRAGSLSNSDAWKSLKLRAASLHDYKLSVLGSSWGFP